MQSGKSVLNFKFPSPRGVEAMPTLWSALDTVDTISYFQYSGNVPYDIIIVLKNRAHCRLLDKYIGLVLGYRTLTKNGCIAF